MRHFQAGQRLLRRSGWITLVGFVVLGCGHDPAPPQMDLPPDPVTLRVSIGALSDTLTWNRSAASDFAAYVIRRRDEVSTSSLLATLDTALDTMWVDETVSPHRAYEYSVQVEDRAGQISIPSVTHVTTRGLDSLTVGLHPRTHVAEPGDTVMVSLWVEAASDLFGAVVGLSFDERQLAFVDCRTGPWMGTETLLLCQEEGNGVALATTRLGNSPALEGWGDLATFRVVIREPGEIALRFTTAPSLLDRAENPISAGPARLYAADWNAVESIGRATAECP